MLTNENANENANNDAGKNISGTQDNLEVDGNVNLAEEGQGNPGDGQASPKEGEPFGQAEENPTAEPAYVSDLRREVAELRSWRENQDKRFAQEQKPKVPEPPRERTEQEWQGIEKNFGITKATRKDDVSGESITEMQIDSRKLLSGISSMMSSAINSVREDVESMMFEQMSPFLLEPVLADYEKRPGDKGGPLADIRQFAPQIREYLKDRYHPRDHAKPKYVMDGYWWAKGQQTKEIQKRAAAVNGQKMRIIQPAGGGSAGQTKPGKPVAKSTGDASVDGFLAEFTK